MSKFKYYFFEFVHLPFIVFLVSFTFVIQQFIKLPSGCKFYNIEIGQNLSRIAQYSQYISFFLLQYWNSQWFTFFNNSTSCQVWFMCKSWWLFYIHTYIHTHLHTHTVQVYIVQCTHRVWFTYETRKYNFSFNTPTGEILYIRLFLLNNIIFNSRFEVHTSK